MKPFTGVTITNYVSGTLETLTIKLTGGGSLSGAGLPNPTTGVYTIAGTPANVTERLRDVSYTPPAGALAPGAETTFELSNTSSAYATAVTNSAIKVVIDNNATTLTITGRQSASMAENVSSQTAVYTAQAENPTANAPLTYSITGGADASDFNIDRNTGVVTFRYVPNFESPVDAYTDNKYEIVVTASDGIYTASKAINIDVTNVNEAPSITSLATAYMYENTVTTGYTALATDPDANTTFTYSILDQDDGRLFTINPRDGAVTFIEAPNYERPQDSNSDNIYQIVVQVSDGALTATKAVSINVRNVNEPPSITSGGATEVTENTRTPVYTVSATDQDVGLTLIYSLSGADSGDFNINSSTGEVVSRSVV